MRLMAWVKKPKYDGATLDEVAAELGVSRARAAQIEVSALKKGRRYLCEHGIEFGDLAASLPDPVRDHELPD